MSYGCVRRVFLWEGGAFLSRRLLGASGPDGKREIRREETNTGASGARKGPTGGGGGVRG